MEMTIPKEQVRFDFKDKCFNLEDDFDKKILSWILNQILYGEITGIQCGYWLYNAPSINAATFLAKQAREELSHVRKILRMLTIIGEKAEPANSIIKFLSSGMMGKTWGEHVAIEMALGEGLVLPIFYFLKDTIPSPEIKKLLESSIKEEESHVFFGEQETIKWLKENPADKNRLLTMTLIQFYSLKIFKVFATKRTSKANPNHKVLSQFELFFDHVIGGFEKRIELLNISNKPLSQISILKVIGLIFAFPFVNYIAHRKYKMKKLTEIYLNDPVVKSEFIYTDET
jgi:hypothetical protein